VRDLVDDEKTMPPAIAEHETARHRIMREGKRIETGRGKIEISGRG
jgi:hypothetical protein